MYYCLKLFFLRNKFHFEVSFTDNYMLPYCICYKVHHSPKRIWGATVRLTIIVFETALIMESPHDKSQVHLNFKFKDCFRLVLAKQSLSQLFMLASTRKFKYFHSIHLSAHLSVIQYFIRCLVRCLDRQYCMGLILSG